MDSIRARPSFHQFVLLAKDNRPSLLAYYSTARAASVSEIPRAPVKRLGPDSIARWRAEWSTCNQKLYRKLNSRIRRYRPKPHSEKLWAQEVAQFVRLKRKESWRQQEQRFVRLLCLSWPNIIVGPRRATAWVRRLIGVQDKGSGQYSCGDPTFEPSRAITSPSR